MTQTASAVRAREYETIYILKPDVTREAAQKVATRVDEAIQREGGRLTLVETWGRRTLAYPIQKHRRGVYVYVKYVGHGSSVAELERNLKMLDGVLRYQTVQVRAEVDPSEVQVDPELVKFEAIELPPEPEEELSLERRLGLSEVPEEARPPRDDFEDEALSGLNVPEEGS